MNITKILRQVFVLQLVIAGIIALLGETGVLPAGVLSGDDERTYVLSIVGVVLGIAFIPLALKLLHLKRVRVHLLEGHASSSDDAMPAQDDNNIRERYKMWSIVRLCLLWVALTYNLIMYYLLDFNTTCGYLALMTLVAYIFVWPSDERMESECEADVNARPRI